MRSFTRRELAIAALSATTVPATGQESASSGLRASDEAAVQAKYANVLRKYGDRLTKDQRNRVRDTIGRHQRMLMRVREFALENSDAPATTLRLYPDSDGTGGRNR